MATRSESFAVVKSERITRTDLRLLKLSLKNAYLRLTCPNLTAHICETYLKQWSNIATNVVSKIK